MDRSLDEIIKETRANPFAAVQAKAPGGKKKGKGGGGEPRDAKAALMKAVNQNNKAKRSAKANTARGMDVDMAESSSNSLAKSRREKLSSGKVTGKKAKGKTMPTNTLKARMAASSVFGSGAANTASPKASDIKITISGESKNGRAQNPVAARAPGGKKFLGGIARAPGGKKFLGGIVKPGALPAKRPVGAVKKMARQKVRSVVVNKHVTKKATQGISKGGGRGGGLLARARL